MRKTIFMGMGLALSLAAVAVAQQPGGPGGPPPGGMRRGPGDRGRMEEMLFQGITLSDAQKAQIAKLNSADSAKMEANRAAMRAQMDSAWSARQRGDTAAARAIFERGRAAMQQHFDERTASVRNVLTADQRVQFDKNIADLKARVQQRGGFGPGGPGRDHHTRGPRARRGGLFSGIALTDAQKTQLRQLRESSRTGLRSTQLRFAEARVAQLKGDTVQARALRSQAVQELQQARQLGLAAVRNVLTADQRTQFDRNLQDAQLRGGFGHRRGWGGSRGFNRFG